MTVTVKHGKTNAIADWTQADLDAQIALGNFPAGTTLADIVLPSDWNDDHSVNGLATVAETGSYNDLTDKPTLGTIASQNANNVAISGGAINGTTIGATTASTGKFTSVTTPSVTASATDLTLSAISTGAVKFQTLGGLQAQVIDQSSADLIWSVKGGSSSLAARATLGTNQGAPNFYATGNVIIFTTNGANNADALRIAHTASAVNYVQVTGSATTAAPVISAQGSDTNIPFNVWTKGNQAFNFYTNGGSQRQFRVIHTTSAVNFPYVTGSATGNASLFGIDALSTDSNVSMAFQPKGTGAIDLAAGSSGVNISNGGTVTAITRTANGTGYTSIPSVAITAPTTAGGVQATASATMFAISATVQAGGTGYTLNDVLTISGGVFSTAATFTVTGVSGGVVTAVTLATGGTAYSTLPTNPVSTTGGTGTGCTLNITSWGVSTIPVGTAGSGYIEQPTVSFSGGGGSGAAAYATVGAGSIIRALGATGTQAIDFHTPSSATNGVPALRVRDTTGDSYFMAQVQGGSAILTAQGNTNANAMISANGTGSVTLRTNGGNQVEQMRVAHTASAVNYVQVTGQVTGAGASVLGGILFTGSDTNVNGAITMKGTGYIAIAGSGATSNQAFRINTANAIATGNLIAVQGSAAGSAPSISAISGPNGTDTNIDLALTPKGTGLVRFGTYTAGAPTATGYISIKAADGTTYKVLVGT